MGRVRVGMNHKTSDGLPAPLACSGLLPACLTICLPCPALPPACPALSICLLGLQVLVDGFQHEQPDYWLNFGNPWELERLNVAYPISFYGHVSGGGRVACWLAAGWCAAGGCGAVAVGLHVGHVVLQGALLERGSTNSCTALQTLF